MLANLNQRKMGILKVGLLILLVFQISGIAILGKYANNAGKKNFITYTAVVLAEVEFSIKVFQIYMVLAFNNLAGKKFENLFHRNAS